MQKKSYLFRYGPKGELCKRHSPVRLSGRKNYDGKGAATFKQSAAACIYQPTIPGGAVYSFISNRSTPGV